VFTQTRQDPEIAARRQELARVEDQRESMLRDHTQELESEVAEYAATSRRLKRLLETHLPLATQKVDFQLASYRAGKTDLTPVLNVRRELIDERLKQIELEGKRAVIVARLHYFYGAGGIDSQTAAPVAVTR
jgi:outer membrane protein TolC